ncbi:MAG: hypothetical protein JW795_11190 [Chitinivibrionales bacterium]|nr:hypothetical protein [Chitinivibrionales bacterium]
MIQINLTSQPYSKKHVKSKKRVVLPEAALKLINAKVIKYILIGLVGIICCGVIFFLSTTLFRSRAPHTEAITVIDEYIPSPQGSSVGIEELVPDKDASAEKLQTKGVLHLPYDQMSFIERVNYEIQFVKNVLDLLGKTVIIGVDFKTITMSAFKAVSGVGVSQSKEKVTTVFAHLRKEKATLLPEPFSKITATGDGAAFVVSCTVEFGLDFESPFMLAATDIIAPIDCNEVLDRMAETASIDSVTIRTQPAQIQAVMAGQYRRFYYRFTASSSYTNFANFITNCYRRRIPVAFDELKMAAVKTNVLEITADIVLTTTFE